ncbi:hypothetical protein ACIBFB_12550 [Nocardiopsis sp. NPDC050513]|uniref:hypothetical protein n=1 Tax=Nocardiopsis sp. NPDC050513 TaxID=3364338 RepID=UPI00378A42C1
MQPQRPKTGMIFHWIGCLAFIPFLGWHMWVFEDGRWKVLPFCWLLFLWFLVRDTSKYRRSMHEYLEHQATQSPKEKSTP